MSVRGGSGRGGRGPLPPPPRGRRGWPWTGRPPAIPPRAPGGVRWPRIAVVTPSLNQGEFLEATVRSVLLQGYPELEYVVMDGGSTDASVAVLERYGPWIDSWSSGPDAGQADAIRRGFARAGGEVLAWLNSDDFLQPGALRRVGEAFARDPGLGWVVGGHAWVRADGRLCRKQPAVPQDAVSLLCAGQRFAQAAVFWRRELYERVGGLDAALRFCFDFDLFIRFAREAPAGRVAGLLAAVRDHPATKSNTIWGTVGLAEAAEVRRRHGLDAIPACERERVARDEERARRAAVRRGLAADAVLDPVYVARRAASSLRDTLGGAAGAAGRGPERVAAELRHQLFKRRGRRAVFERIHRENLFGGTESASGPGSSPIAARAVARRIELLVRELGVASVLDAPCGDFAWMRDVDLGAAGYTGVDIVPAIVERNRAAFGRPGREFLARDIVRDPLPEADLVLCRDCLVHLSHRDALAAVRNLARSGSRWLLATTFPGASVNRDIVTGQWRPLNLCLPPFGFPAPGRLVREDAPDAGEENADKSLGLWRLADLASLPGVARARARR